MLYTALILGLLGSFHCVGMCGPLTLLLPLRHDNPFKKAIQVATETIQGRLAAPAPRSATRPRPEAQHRARLGSPVSESAAKAAAIHQPVGTVGVTGVQICGKGAHHPHHTATNRWNGTIGSHPDPPLKGLCCRFGHRDRP